MFKNLIYDTVSCGWFWFARIMISGIYDTIFFCPCQPAVLVSIGDTIGIHLAANKKGGKEKKSWLVKSQDPS